MTAASGAMLLLLLLASSEAAARAQRPAEEEAAAAAAGAAREHRQRYAHGLSGLAGLLRERVDDIRSRTEQLELVFLIDGSASVGEANFRGALSFVRKLLLDFRLSATGARVAIVTFGGRGQILRHVDYVSRQPAGRADKCQLLDRRLRGIGYTGGGTFTFGALMEAYSIFESSRAGAEKVIFLVTDGLSSGPDPRHAAKLLKSVGVTIFTFGVQAGNVDELHDIASEPSYAYSYLLSNFSDFESLARKALHRDLKAGLYTRVGDPRECAQLCSSGESSIGLLPANPISCCDPIASCSCGTASGHYACMCPQGYTGSGLLGSCRPCPNGTYGWQSDPHDLSTSCVPCPDANHVTVKIPAISLKDCTCAFGFTGDRGTCEAITCPKLIVPENGYFVKANDCNNVVNAACGIRCRIGFHLAGDSIRLCSNNGSWTGEDTQCLLKTCPALRAPANGRIRCEHETENNRSKVNDTSAQPIDTRCQFKCEPGFQLRGSKVRNCLPLARWDGLKTTCKPIYCEPLKSITNAEIHPRSCLGPRKLPYASNCTVACKKGYKLEGPRVRTCLGRHGTWSKRHSASRCLDRTRPVIKCPANVSANALPGKNYAYVSWQVPSASDNSAGKCHVWSRPHVTLPWKVHVGRRVVKYIAQDASGNKARCSFTVHVLDKEPPKIENCENNQLYLTGSERSLREFVWDEPLFYDNSGLPVKINKTFRSTTGPFTQGRHSVSYRVMDKYKNVAKCLVNLTIQDPCNNVPKPLNGRSQCTNTKKGGKRCNLYCDPGYAFALDNNSNNTTVNASVSSAFQVAKSQPDKIVAMCSPKTHSWNLTAFPDCSPVKVSNTISQEGIIILEGDAVDCDNTALIEKLSKSINLSYNFNVINLCTDQLECNVYNEISCNQFVARVTRDVARNALTDSKNGTNASKKPRSLSTSQPIEIKMKFIAKIVEDNRNSPQLGLVKVKDKLQSMTKSGELNLLDDEMKQEIGKLTSNLHLLFKDPQATCEPGSILRKVGCVKCPAGTFHNATKGQCQSCYYGEYQSVAGSTKCEKCPTNYFTRRMHARFISECIPACQPGYYSRRRHQQHHHQPDSYLGPSLGPCASCEIGFYQPRHGQTQCLACPRDTSTEGRGSKALEDCLGLEQSQIDPCRRTPCLNRAACVKERDGFSCDCREHFVGSRCEIFVDPCLSSPCSSAGQCISSNSSDTQWSYVCSCKPGYTGKFCEILINECSYTPCRNGGTCTSSEADITCACKDGFEGDFCEVSLNHCASSPCEMNSSCRSVNGTWKCSCQPGYLGLRCNLLPCDWLPCQPWQVCVNLAKEAADKSDYRCECPEGWSGENCQTAIDHCKSSPCLNNGTCASLLLNYTCTCDIPFAGLKCEIVLSSDYALHFSRSGTSDYAIVPGPRKDFAELTVCFWLQSVDTLNYGTVVSYATHRQDNAFTLTDYNGFVLYVNGEKVITDARMNDGYWHFICVSWESKLGSWQFYVDGALKDNGTLLSRNMEIEGNGMFVFGQEQDEVGGGFSESESFLGKLYLLDIWDSVKDANFINKLSRTCEKYYGSLLAWAQLKDHIRGNVEIVESLFCKGCPPTVAPFKGYVNISKDGLEASYSCETGYEFRSQDHKRFNTVNRKCLINGQWEAAQVLTCVRVSCPHPGYFLRGWIQGRSFMYSDKIIYHCNEGHNLHGNPQRVCKADGNWSGITPYCIGVTCKNLLAPDHGDIEYIIDEHDRDDLSILQVGHKLEFKCDAGYVISGRKILTCLQNGTWDYKRPTCLLMGCPPPKQISHGRMLAYTSSNATSSSSQLSEQHRNSSHEQKQYLHGDIVTMACDPGYKFQDNRNLAAELKLQCTADGDWMGNMTDCIARRCTWPQPVENAAIYILVHDVNDTSIEKILEEIPVNSSVILRKYAGTDKSKISKAENSDEKYLRIGTQIKVVCDEGFNASVASIVRHCTENEVWSGDDVHCTPVRCFAENHPIIGLLANNNYTAVSQDFGDADSQENDATSNDLSKRFAEIFDFFYKGDAFGDDVVLKCKNPKENDVELIWKCSKDGSWKFASGAIDENTVSVMLLMEEKNICASKKCKTPEPPAHGYVTDKNNTKISDNAEYTDLRSVTFKCDDGYRQVGAEKSSCLENGTWSSTPICQPITCARPPQVLNAEPLSGNSKTAFLLFGSTISYRCLSGYKNNGQSLDIHCMANGLWSKVNGKCEKISCGRPPLIPGASIQGNSYLHQDRLIYICPGGKFRDMIVCNQDGKWSNLPKCT